MYRDALKALLRLRQVGVVVMFALRAARGKRQRLILFCFLGGYLFDSAIGTTYQDVPSYLLWASFSFALASVAGFAIGKTVFAGVGRVIAENSNRTFDRINTRRFAAYIITRSEEHTSELQSLMRISYAVFCLKKKTII